MSHFQIGNGSQGSVVEEAKDLDDAGYEGARPDGDDGLQKFLREWRRDLREEDTVRFQPIKMV